MIIIILGTLVSLVGAIWLISLAFIDEQVKGWMCIFLGWVGMTIYAVDNWRKVKTPFLIFMGGQLIIGAYFLFMLNL